MSRKGTPLWQVRVNDAVRCRGGSPSKALVEPGLAAPYDRDDVEFLRAVDDFRRRTGAVPTLYQGFLIARALGWRKLTRRERKTEAMRGLRSRAAPPARKAAADRRCKAGHALNPRNVNPHGECMVCRRARDRGAKRRKRAGRQEPRSAAPGS